MSRSVANKLLLYTGHEEDDNNGDEMRLICTLGNDWSDVGSLWEVRKRVDRRIMWEMGFEDVHHSQSAVIFGPKTVKLIKICPLKTNHSF